MSENDDLISSWSHVYRQVCKKNKQKNPPKSSLHSFFHYHADTKDLLCWYYNNLDFWWNVNSTCIWDILITILWSGRILTCDPSLLMLIFYHDNNFPQGLIKSSLCLSSKGCNKNWLTGSHLQHIQQIFLRDGRKFNFMRRINDCVQLGNLIGDALEWCFPICHAVEDTSEGPHVSFGAYL